jgi:hypothetical protein
LKLTDQEFGSYSLKQIRALTERYNTERKEQEYLHALICSVIANTKSKKSFKPKDFMRKEKQKAQTAEEMYQLLKVVTLANGGDVIG